MMKLSRLWGAAVTCGTLLGGGSGYAQVPNYNAPGYPMVPAYAASPQTAATIYPSTDGYTYAVASLPATQFSGPANTPISRLPLNPQASLASHPPIANATGPITGPGYAVPPAAGYSQAQVYGSGLAANVALPAPNAQPNYGMPTGYGPAMNSPNHTPMTNNSSMPNLGSMPGYTPTNSVLGNVSTMNHGGPGVQPGISGMNGAHADAYGSHGPIQGGISGPAPSMGMGYGGQGYGGQVNGSCGVSGAGLQPFANYGYGCEAPAAYRPSRWYAGGYGLWLTRDRQDHYTFSYDTGNEAIQFTDAKEADVGWGGGFATVVGHYFNCGCNAIEGVYWGWFPEDDRLYTYGSAAIGDLNGIFNWDSLTYNGANMGVFVDDAEVHALYRQNEAHNVEVNILSFGGGFSGSSLRFTGLAGFRYFRFRDNLLFASDPNDQQFTGEVDEIYYNIETINNLIGFQVGGVGTYCPSERLSVNAGTKVGFFGNHISHLSHIGGPAGTAVINNGPNAGRQFYVDNSKNDVSFLTEVFVGVGYSISPRWTASAGYRAMAITGLASPTDQIYPDLRGINDLDTIESQSSLILHGAYFGAQYCF